MTAEAVLQIKMTQYTSVKTQGHCSNACRSF